jgi:phenylpropionate dioxygenase-like ring-hydroxylating dioxygenase large terminal subunit
MTAHQPLDNQQHYEQVVPTESFISRIRRIMGLHYYLKTMNALGRLPGLSRLRQRAGQPRLLPFSSEAGFMANWYKKPFGTPDKPESLSEMPWDYLAENQEEIPFFGLRNYWYPAIVASELPHNETRTVQLLGDNIVVFRGRDGAIGALENRCPHRGPMLSLGQPNVWDIGTLTCRYHGATFNTQGDCVAFLGDGPDSRMCGNPKMKVRSFPACERNGVVYLWMGDGEPEDILDNIPRARDTLADGHYFAFNGVIPYSYLNLVDNATDMTHVGCLHRTCALFGDQKMGGGVSAEEIDGRGVRASIGDPGGHAGSHAIDDIEWYLPGMVFHGREFMDGIMHGLWFWWVPRDAGSFTAWFIASVDKSRGSKRTARKVRGRLQNAMQSDMFPGLACFIGGDAPIQMSQGKVVRWDRENLVRGDRAVVKCRQMLKDAHAREIAQRRERGLPGLIHRIDHPGEETQTLQVRDSGA